MGQVKLPLIRYYLNTNEEFKVVLEAAKMMSLIRFENILDSLHLANNNLINKIDFLKLFL